MEKTLVLVLILSFLISNFINIFLKKINVPTILGYILTSAVVSHFFNINSDSIGFSAIFSVSEFGIILLMFIIGLEFSVDSLIKIKREVFLNGFLQVGLTTTIFFLITYYLFNIDIKTAIIISSALSMSSTAILLKILNENGEIRKPYGTNTLGILLFQDIWIIPLLIMLSVLESPSLSVSNLVIKTLVSAGVFIIILFFVAEYLLRYIFNLVANTQSNEIFIGFIFFIVVGSSILSYMLGFSYGLGSFVAGVIISETKFKYQVQADIEPFKDLFLGIFFIIVGITINIDFIKNNILSILLFLTLLFIVKILVVFLITIATSNKRTALKSAIVLFQVGEFSIVLLNIARFHTLINIAIFQTIMAIAVISMIMTPLLVQNISRLVDFFIKEDNTKPTLALPKKKKKFHIVVCGYSNLGQALVKKLQSLNIDMVLVENSIHLYTLARERGIKVYFGNIASKKMLETLNIKDARAVILAITNEEKLKPICQSILLFAQNTSLIVKVNGQKEEDEMASLGVKNIINQSNEIANILVDRVIDTGEQS